MATPLLPPIDDADLAEPLKINSVKHLPQSKQVPTIYNAQFFNTEIIDTHLVIRTLRQDLTAVQQVLKDPINKSLTNYNVVIAEMLLRLDDMDLVLADHESRISALENP